MEANVAENVVLAWQCLVANKGHSMAVSSFMLMVNTALLYFPLPTLPDGRKKSDLCA